IHGRRVSGRRRPGRWRPGHGSGRRARPGSGYRTRPGPGTVGVSPALADWPDDRAEAPQGLVGSVAAITLRCSLRRLTNSHNALRLPAYHAPCPPGTATMSHCGGPDRINVTSWRLAHGADAASAFPGATLTPRHARCLLPDVRPCR